jgi:arsenate reductase
VAAAPRSLARIGAAEAGVTITIHGIRNCDTMKKARAWLDAHGVAHAFHDYKVAGIDRATLEGWARKLGWETLLNRAGTTFRKLPDDQKQGITESRAIEMMMAQPSMIRRPVLAIGERLVVGFDTAEYEAAIASLPRD